MTNALAAVEALGDPVRRALVESLAARPQSVTELAADLPVTRSVVSQHLGVLAGAGIVDYEVRSRRHPYHVEPDALAGLRAYLDRLWDAALATYAALADDRESTVDSASLDAPAGLRPGWTNRRRPTSSTVDLTAGAAESSQRVS